MSTATATVETPKPKSQPPHVSRFQMADLADEAVWLGTRLKERYDDLDSRTLATRLTGWMNSNAHFFVKTKNAVALAELRNEFLNPHKIVRVVFVLAHTFENKAQDAIALKEAGYLCSEIERWAYNMAVSQVEDWEYHNDLDRDAIKSYTLGKMYLRECLVTKLKEARDAPA